MISTIVHRRNVNFSWLWRPSGQRHIPVHIAQCHTSPTSSILVWDDTLVRQQAALVHNFGNLSARECVNQVWSIVHIRADCLLLVVPARQRTATPHTLISQQPLNSSPILLMWCLDEYEMSWTPPTYSIYGYRAAVILYQHGTCIGRRPIMQHYRSCLEACP